MTFNPTNFRRIDRGEVAPRNIRADRNVVLILVKPDGTATTATDRGGKDAIVKDYAPDDLLMMVWAGKWKTETFTIDREDLDLIYETTR